MKILLSILMFLSLAISSLAGPPEPPEPEAPTPPVAPNINKREIVVPMIDTAKINRLTKNLEGMDKKLAQIDRLINRLSDSISIKDLTIGGDSILIVLSNDSVLSLATNTIANLPHNDNSFVNVGHTYTVKEGEVIDGNIVNVGADVIVKGTVNGSVLTMGGNIYVTSTGFIRDGTVALSGKLKVDPGGRVNNVKLAFNESRYDTHRSGSNIYRVMAAIFLIIYAIWLVLAATFTSLMKDNVKRVMDVIGTRPWKSFLYGYLAFLLTFAVFIALNITIIGIPIAWVGVPVALFAGMVLAVTSLSNILGQKLLGNQELSLKTFLYGTLIFGGLPGLFFVIQLITGSLVIMIFSWIMIGILVFVIVPLGLGAVLMTRFGTRAIPPVKTNPMAPATSTGPQVAPHAPSG